MATVQAPSATDDRVYLKPRGPGDDLIYVNYNLRVGRKLLQGSHQRRDPNDRRRCRHAASHRGGSCSLPEGGQRDRATQAALRALGAS